jgi:hypothetical protein
MTTGHPPRAPWRLLAELSLPAAGQPHPAAGSALGIEAALAAAVAAGVGELGLPPARLAQLQSAVAAAAEAAEAAVPAAAAVAGAPAGGVRLRVLVAADAKAPGPPCPQRGWGFFIIEASGQAQPGRALEVYLYREGEVRPE